MESIYTIATEVDRRDWFGANTATHRQARRMVFRMMRDDFGVILDEDIFDIDAFLLGAVWYKPIFMGACIAVRRLHGWGVFGEWVHMTASDVANNFGHMPFDMIM